MPLLSLGNTEIDFDTKDFIQRLYTIIETLPSTSRVELINKKEFAKVVLDENSKTVVVHVMALMAIESIGMKVRLSQALQLATLQWDNTLTKISAKYTNYTDIFSPDLVIDLPKNTGINEYIIELLDGTQLPYGPIYTFSPGELHTLKIYIKTHLKTGFIQSFKSSANTLIFFNKQSNGSLYLCINYQGLTNLTIKNLYSLPLISKSLNRLGQAKQFTQLDLLIPIIK